jgi:hypothetical protein
MIIAHFSMLFGRLFPFHNESLCDLRPRFLTQPGILRGEHFVQNGKSRINRRGAPINRTVHRVSIDRLNLVSYPLAIVIGNFLSGLFREIGLQIRFKGLIDFNLVVGRMAARASEAPTGRNVIAWRTAPGLANAKSYKP